MASQRVSFVNRVSHELRTPLTNMLLNLDIVEDALPESSSPTQRRLTLVKEEAARLTRLIDNVLTFSRAEQGRLRLRTDACHPHAVVDAVLDQFAAGLARRDITVSRSHSGNDVSCVMDADALAQITANLLSNVEKYAPGKPVMVTTCQTTSRLQLAVRDEGPGVPQAEQDHIFTPFVRLDDRLRAGVTGTGLGLSIARELAERMGGTLRLETSQGERSGACFVLDVPVAPAAGSASSPLPAGPFSVSAPAPL